MTESGRSPHSGPVRARLRVDELAKTYRVKKKNRVKEINALKGVSFTAQPGEVIGVIGPSRAGKTTLLRIVSGVSPPTRGKVEGFGRVIPLLDPGAFFQDENSGFRNAHDMAALFGIPSELVEEKTDSVFEFAGLEEFRRVPVKRYSRGMYLRLAFAVALGFEPDIFVADDVLGVGDLEFQERCMRRLRELAGTGGIVLIVSHDPQTLSRLCNRLLWLKDGELLRDGSPAALLDEYVESSAKVAEENILHFSRGASENDYCRFIGVSLVDESGDPVDRMSTIDRAGIRLEFEMLQEGYEPRCSVDVFAWGALAFRSEADPVPLDPGRYSSTAWIPGGLLAPTMYAVRAEVTLAPRNQVRSTELSFAVENPMDGRHEQRALPSFPGRVAPVWDWQLDLAKRT